jgi:hypothetical protein
LKTRVFSACSAPNGDLQPNPQKFPQGIKHVADYIKSLGDGLLKLGIYSEHDKADCCGGPGMKGFEDQDAKFFAKNGVEYLKVDSCAGHDLNATTMYQVNAKRFSKRFLFFLSKLSFRNANRSFVMTDSGQTEYGNKNANDARLCNISSGLRQYSRRVEPHRCEQRLFCAILYQKSTINQDRLGTNVGKAETEGVCVQAPLFTSISVQPLRWQRRFRASTRPATLGCEGINTVFFLN